MENLRRLPGPYHWRH